MFITYKDWNPTKKSLTLIEIANLIIDEYAESGYVLTLRQLYYQFVARDLIENSEKSYKNLGSVITKGREAGMISWRAIEDRNREFNDFWFEEDESNLISKLHQYIRFDRWERQENYVEVWVEKEALGNVVSRACEPWLVPHMSCKGYLSASEAWRAGARFEEKIMQGKRCTLIHLGDHDPSGIDMTRDNRARVDLFSGSEDMIEVVRVALNRDQIDEFDPPPNPAKVTDSRAKQYIKKYGRTSWELDALEPSVIEEMITSQIKSRIDIDIWEDVASEEDETEEVLKKLANNWDKIKVELEQ